MAHDYNIKHFDIRDIIFFKPNLWIGVFTIKLVNNKYETVVVRSNEKKNYASLHIYFLNVHVKNELAAINFHNFTKNRLSEISKDFNNPNFNELLDYIEKNIPELNRYRNSVDYEYPKDVVEHRD
jgi:hypothetical protein